MVDRRASEDHRAAKVSTWKEEEPDDIHIDQDRKEVDILASTDDLGNNYVSLTFRQIYDIVGRIEANK